MSTFMLCKFVFLSLALSAVILPSGARAAQPNVPSPAGGNWEYAVSFNDHISLFTGNWSQVGEIAEGFHQISSLIYDEIGDQIYFIDTSKSENSSIYCLGRDPKNPHTYVTLDNVVEKVHEAEVIRGLAFDPVERILYWIDEKLRRIFKLDVKQPQAQPTIWLNFTEKVPQALAVDACRRYLYWSTDNSELKVTTIEKARLDRNSEVTPIVLISDKLKRPIALEIDQYSNRMFWISDQGGNQVSVESADLQGNERQVIYEGAGKKFRSLIVEQRNVLVVDFQNDGVFQFAKTEDAEVQKLQEFHYAPRGLIKRSRFIDTHEDHAICESAVYLFSEQVKSTTPPAFSLVTIENATVICLNGKVDAEGHCKCSDGWTGKHCETKVCLNYCFHGACAVSSTGYPLCHCQPGFTGERCEISKCSGYCLNEGVCRIENEEPVCHCSQSFTGRHCEIINVMPMICRAYCELGVTFPNIDWEIEDECRCGNRTAGEALCTIRSPGGPLGQNIIYIIVAAVLVTIVLLVVMVLSAIRRWYKPARPKIKKTYVVRKNVTPMTYRPTPTERCEITIENCCNMEYCDTPCFDPKILVKDSNEKEVSAAATKEDKRDLLSNIVLDNNSDLF